jgi:hypothetical protein
LVEIANVDDSKVLDTVGDLIENFILSHAIRIPIATETDDNQALFFAHNSLVDVPASDKMREYDGPGI